jgi:hypothetical protein
LALIEPDLWHLNVIALEQEMIDVKDTFIRLANDIGGTLAG